LGEFSRRNSAPVGGPPWPVASFSPELVNNAILGTKKGKKITRTKLKSRRTHLDAYFAAESSRGGRSTQRAELGLLLRFGTE